MGAYNVMSRAAGQAAQVAQASATASGDLLQRIARRVELLQQAKEAYYNGAQPLLSDAEFDRLEDELREWQPQHPYFNVVGRAAPAAPDGADKIRHEVPMLSMDKVKKVVGVEAWFQRLLDNSTQLRRDTPLCIQPKIDGISASCVYRAGKLRYVATRGDGRQGQNISHLAPFVEDIPQVLAQSLDLEVRGELYVPKDIATVRGNERPLRNICAGLINRKEHDRVALRQLRFIAYQCPRQRLESSEFHQIGALARLGFHTVEPKLCLIGDLAEYAQLYLNELRQAWPYETDGLIMCLDDSDLFAVIDDLWVVSHHHHYTIALKPPAASGTTLLREVRWQLGRQGRLSPVAEFLPLTLASAVIERAALHNYANVLRLKLQRGDVLEIERAGDVIPYVRRNLGSPKQLLAAAGNSLNYLSCRQRPGRDGNAAESAPNSGSLSLATASELAGQLRGQFGASLLPARCPSCGGPLLESGPDLLCPQRSCPEQVIQRILFWVRQAGMEQVAEQSIRRLYELGKLRSLQDLYRLCAEDLRDIPGYAEKKIAKFVREREASRRLNLHQLIERLGIPLIQEKSLKKLGELRRKSRWENFLQQTAAMWQQGQSEAHASGVGSDNDNNADLQKRLCRAMAENLPIVLYDWSAWQSTMAGNLATKIFEYLLLQTGKKVAPTEALPRLLRLWGSRTGRNELWKNGFSLWEAELLRGQPDYLELRRIEDFVDFKEPASRYSVLENLSQWLAHKENQLLLQELLPVLQLQDIQTGIAGGAKRTVCMTGSGPLPRKQLEERLRAGGYGISSTLTTSTDILLCADPKAGSAKLKKAAEWGIGVYSYEEFLQGLGPAALQESAKEQGVKQ